MSNSAYDPINEYTMGWTYCAPTDLKVNYYQSSNTATLIWTHRNGKQTDVAYVERRAEGESSWTVIKEKGRWYVYDPNFRNETGRNGYRIWYGKKGTWRYRGYHKMN